jgi:hypothetical protein
LLSRGYASLSALKIVGDRYGLEARQRVAVARCACSDDALDHRRQRELEARHLEGKDLWIDGYNVLTSIEAALSGGVILHARDGCYRDMASMHGTYRAVEETIPAARHLGELAAEWGVANCHWLLDQPVSNSGRLKTMLRELAAAQSWNWQVELAPSPDTLFCRSSGIAATADSHILDRVLHWFNFARLAIDLRISGAWIINLSNSSI